MLESLCQIKTPKQHKGNEMEQVLIGYLKEVESSIDTTHERLGISINPEDAVIIGVLTVLYSDGRTEDVEL